MEQYKEQDHVRKCFNNEVEKLHIDDGGEYKTIEVNLQTEIEARLLRKAIRNALCTSNRKGTWSLVLYKNKHVHALTSHIVLKIKKDENRNVTKVKSCVVFGGHKQNYKRFKYTV